MRGRLLTYLTRSREMPPDYEKEEEIDEMAIEALFEDVHFVGRGAMKRATPPNLDSMSGPLAEIVDKSDLVPGVYEGGFKVWEGSVDLVNYLVKEKVNLKGLRVIDLGCGHAFPGMHAAMEGAHVDLQDYNEEVINEVTMMNVIANLRGVVRLCLLPARACPCGQGVRESVGAREGGMELRLAIAIARARARCGGQG